MNCSYQYLSIDKKKICHAHFTAHKLKKIVNMNADISENIKDRELGFQKFLTEMYYSRQYLSSIPAAVGRTSVGSCA